MTQQVITVGADASIVDAINTMLHYHVSGLPVVDAAGKLIGIVSEGDFIRRAEIGIQPSRGRWLRHLLSASQTAADFVHERGRKVSDIMTPAPLTITEDAQLDEIARIMESHGVKRLPVMRGAQLVGIVTRSDFLPAVASLARHAPTFSVADDQLRSEILAAVGRAAWRPCRLKVTVCDGVVSLSGIVRGDDARRAAIVAAENVAGVREVHDDLLEAADDPPPEEDLGGGDIVSLEQQPSTTDDEPL